MGRKNAGIKTVCENRKARHDYFIHETYEAGIALQGTEVKSLRAGRANLKDSYASIQNGEIFVENLHISLRPGQYLQPRSPAPQEAPDAQGRDRQALRQDT